MLLVKPQFEVGPGHIARGGVVRDEQPRLDAVESVREAWLAAGWRWCGSMESPITGGDGNVEYLVWMERT